MSMRRWSGRGLVGIGSALTTGLVLASGATSTSLASAVPATGVIGTLNAASPAVPERVSEGPRAQWRVNGTVYAVKVSGSRVYLGGDFASVTNRRTGVRVQRHNLVAFQRATGDLIRKWRPSTNGAVRGVAISNATNQVFIGGAFTTVNGNDRQNIAALGLGRGFIDRTWNASVTKGVVRDVLLRRGRLYVAGSFYRAGDLTGDRKQHGLAAFGRPDGSLVRSWNARIGQGRVFSLLVARGGHSLIVGGGFDTLSGVPRTHLGAVDLAGGAVTRWAPRPRCGECSVLALTRDRFKVYAGMAGPGGRVAAYGSQRRRARWETTGNGDVQAVDVRRGVVYAGGHFQRFSGRAQSQLVALRASTGRITDFSPEFGDPARPGVWAIAAARDYLRVGGGFDHIAERRIAGYTEFRVIE